LRPGCARGLGPALRPPRGLAAIAIVAVLLGGCTALNAGLPSDLSGLIGPPQKRFEGTPAHGAAPAAAIASLEPATAPVTSAAAAPPRPPLNDVRELIGLEREQIQARLGDPALRRRDAPAEIWQYRSPLCVLDVFLYRDGTAMRVTNAELRPRDGRELPAATCLSSL
jgi:hypothetical protein